MINYENVTQNIQSETSIFDSIRLLRINAESQQWELFISQFENLLTRFSELKNSPSLENAKPLLQKLFVDAIRHLMNNSLNDAETQCQYLKIIVLGLVKFSEINILASTVNEIIKIANQKCEPINISLMDSNQQCYLQVSIYFAHLVLSLAHNPLTKLSEKQLDNCFDAAHQLLAMIEMKQVKASWEQILPVIYIWQENAVYEPEWKVLFDHASSNELPLNISMKEIQTEKDIEKFLNKFRKVGEWLIAHLKLARLPHIEDKFCYRKNRLLQFHNIGQQLLKYSAKDNTGIWHQPRLEIISILDKIDVAEKAPVNSITFQWAVWKRDNKEKWKNKYLNIFNKPLELTKKQGEWQKIVVKQVEKLLANFIKSLQISPNVLENLSFIALGSLARGDVYPFSDIEGFFIFPPCKNEEIKKYYQQLCNALYDFLERILNIRFYDHLNLDKIPFIGKAQELEEFKKEFSQFNQQRLQLEDRFELFLGMKYIWGNQELFNHLDGYLASILKMVYPHVYVGFPIINKSIQQFKSEPIPLELASGVTHSQTISWMLINKLICQDEEQWQLNTDEWIVKKNIQCNLKKHILNQLIFPIIALGLWFGYKGSPLTIIEQLFKNNHLSEKTAQALGDAIKILQELRIALAIKNNLPANIVYEDSLPITSLDGILISASHRQEIIRIISYAVWPFHILLKQFLAEPSINKLPNLAEACLKEFQYNILQVYEIWLRRNNVIIYQTVEEYYPKKKKYQRATNPSDFRQRLTIISEGLIQQFNKVEELYIEWPRMLSTLRTLFENNLLEQELLQKFVDNLNFPSLYKKFINDMGIKNISKLGAGKELLAPSINAATIIPFMLNIEGYNFYQSDLSYFEMSRQLDIQNQFESEANFSNTNFSYVNLNNTRAWGTNFSGANFTGASFNNADHQRANYTKANFTNLKSAEGAKFQKADFTGALLLNANMGGANLSQANLSGTVCLNLKLKNAILRGANLSGVKELDVASLKEASDIDNLILINAELKYKATEKQQLKEWLDDCVRKNKIFTSIEQLEEILQGNKGDRQLTDINVSGIVLKSTESSRKKGKGVKLKNVVCHLTAFIGKNLLGAEPEIEDSEFNQAVLQGVDMQSMKATNVNFENAQVIDANLQGAVLNNINLTGANFEKVNFGNAKLSEINFEQANLNKVNFQNAELVQCDLRKAQLDDETINALKDVARLKDCLFPAETIAKLKEFLGTVEFQLFALAKELPVTQELLGSLNDFKANFSSQALKNYNDNIQNLDENIKNYEASMRNTSGIVIESEEKITQATGEIVRSSQGISEANKNISKANQNIESTGKDIEKIRKEIEKITPLVPEFPKNSFVKKKTSIVANQLINCSVEEIQQFLQNSIVDEVMPPPVEWYTLSIEKRKSAVELLLSNNDKILNAEILVMEQWLEAFSRLPYTHLNLTALADFINEHWLEKLLACAKTSLEVLTLDDCKKLKKLELKDFLQLKTIYIKNCQLEKMELANLPNLIIIDAGDLPSSLKTVALNSFQVLTNWRLPETINTVSTISLAEAYRLEAESAYSQEQYQYALESIQIAIQLYPNSNQALPLLVNICEKLDKLNVLESIYEKIEPFNQQNEQYWQQYAELWLKLKNYLKTEECSNKIIQSNPKNAHAYYLQAEIKRAQGSYTFALQKYKEATDITKNNYRYWLGYGDTYSLIKDFHNAYYCYKEGLQKDPHYLLAHRLGYLEETVWKRYKEAQVFYRQAAEQAKIIATYWYDSGRMYNRSPALEDYKQALVHLDNAIKLDSANAGAWQEKIYAYERLGYFKLSFEARIMVSKITLQKIIFDKSNVTFWRDYIYRLHQIHASKEAKRILDEMTDVLTSHTSALNCETLYEIGMLFFYESRYQQAEKFFHSGLKQVNSMASVPKDTFIKFIRILAQTLERLSFYDEALEYYEAGIQNDIEDNKWWYYTHLVAICNDKKVLNEKIPAEESNYRQRFLAKMQMPSIKLTDNEFSGWMLAKRLCGISDKNIDLKFIELHINAFPTAVNYYQRGLLLVALGKYHEALADYDKALTLSANYDEVYYSRGLLHKLMNNQQQALSDLKQAHEINPCNLIITLNYLNQLDEMLNNYALYKANNLTIGQKFADTPVGEMYQAQYLNTGIMLHILNIRNFSPDKLKKWALRLNQLQSPYLVKCLGSANSDLPNKYEIAFKLGQYTTLRQLLAEKTFANNSLARWKIVIDIAKGLSYLHSKDLQQDDLQPEHIVIDRENLAKDNRVKLLNSGWYTLRTQLLKNINPKADSRSSYRWVAPETAIEDNLTKAADIHSFGVMIAHLMTNRLPFGELSANDEDIIKIFVKNNKTSFLEPIKISIVRDKTNDAIAKIVNECWKPKEKRPSIKEVINKLQLFFPIPSTIRELYVLNLFNKNISPSVSLFSLNRPSSLIEKIRGKSNENKPFMLQENNIAYLIQRQSDQEWEKNLEQKLIDFLGAGKFNLHWQNTVAKIELADLAVMKILINKLQEAKLVAPFKISLEKAFSANFAGADEPLTFDIFKRHATPEVISESEKISFNFENVQMAEAFCNYCYLRLTKQLEISTVSPLVNNASEADINANFFSSKDVALLSAKVNPDNNNIQPTIFEEARNSKAENIESNLSKFKVTISIQDYRILLNEISVANSERQESNKKLRGSQFSRSSFFRSTNNISRGNSEILEENSVKNEEKNNINYN